jgi:glycosyltransferase involved in cell wall biosynthesis
MRLTALVNAHREGRLLGATLKSVEQARQKALLTEDDFEVILVLDRPDELTRTIAENWTMTAVSVVIVDYGDAGLARNAGVALARGGIISNLDGDDLWGSRWLELGLGFLGGTNGEVILHAQIAQYFGGDNTAFQSPSMADPAFRVVSMLSRNPWSSLVMAPASVFRRYPYRETSEDHRFAYEDWSWNCDTVAAGLEHLTVPGTVHFVRRRSASLSRESLGRAALPIPHALTLQRAREVESTRRQRSSACER